MSRLEERSPIPNTEVPGGESRAGRPSVLVVDDESATVELLQSILEEDGYETCAATTGSEAVEVYQAEQPDAVLLDVSMPGMNGIETLGEIRRIDPDARVVMLTGDSTHAAVRAAIHGGARNYVLKPFDVSALLSALAAVFIA